jgi:hypothetical protein
LSHPRYWEILTAFKKDKFELLEKEEVDFFRVNLEYLNHNPEDFKRSNKAMLLLLQSIENPCDKLVLGNTQLYLGDQLDFVRQAQALYLMERASDFVRRFNRKSGVKPSPVKGSKSIKQSTKTVSHMNEKLVPFVMGCDLCSAPDCSAFEQLMSKDIFDPNNILSVPKQVNKQNAMS